MSIYTGGRRPSNGFGMCVGLKLIDALMMELRDDVGLVTSADGEKCRKERHRRKFKSTKLLIDLQFL